MKKFIKENAVLLICLVVFVFNVASVIQARTTSNPVPTKVEDSSRIKKVVGKFSGKTRISISIEVNSQQDVLINYDGKTRFRGFKELSELQYGDLLELDCRETYTIEANGKERTTGAVAKLITLTKGNVGGRMISMGSN